MKKYTDKVVISYDSDEAGQRAADKALRLLDAAGVNARVLNIPGAKDPDEYIKRFGAFPGYYLEAKLRLTIKLKKRCKNLILQSRRKRCGQSAPFARRLQRCLPV